MKSHYLSLSFAVTEEKKLDALDQEHVTVQSLLANLIKRFKQMFESQETALELKMKDK